MGRKSASTRCRVRAALSTDSPIRTGNNARLDNEIQVIDRRFLSVSLAEVLCLDHLPVPLSATSVSPELMFPPPALASIHRVNLDDRFPGGWWMELILLFMGACGCCRLLVLRLVRVRCRGSAVAAGVGLWGCGDRVRAGQAAGAGGPVAASNRFSHSVWWCQPSGR